jgi:hypothetical protein
MPDSIISPILGTATTRFTQADVRVLLQADADAAIAARYEALGGGRGFLGAPTAPEEAIPGGRRRVYQGGHIYWSSTTGAWSVRGAILARYLQAGGAAGFLGFPVTDELDGGKAGSKVSRFAHGGIWWSAQTGAREVHGEILRKYLVMGGEGGFLGLPTTDELDHAPGGKRSAFQGGVILWSPGTGAYEVHGAILARYDALGGSAAFLGFPISDETDVRGVGGANGKLSRFVGGTIYWSPATGAFEVHGAIRERYEIIGGPASEFGFPTTNETAVGALGVRYNGFQNGVIAWTGRLGAVGIRDLELHLGWVKSGPIDDGIGDSSAELVTYTTVHVNGQALETNVRRPGGHAGTSYNIDRRYPVPNVRPDTAITFEIKVDDWDKVSSNDYLGTFRRTLDIATMWGLAEDGQGVFIGTPLAHKGGDAPNTGTVRLDFAVRTTRPSAFDPTKTFREQCWWPFGNPTTPTLTTQQYADTYRDVGHRTNWVEKAVHPWDSLFYLAYKGLAAKGNCYGMSLEGALAATDRSLYSEPIHRFGFNDGLRSVFNIKHGYQVGDGSVRWILAKLGTLDAIRPRRVYDNVRAAIARRDWPLISMFNLSSFTGHTVLGYECPPVPAGRPLVIRVADPNAPFGAGGALHPTYIEIDPAADTFRFVTPNGVKYQSTRIADLLPGTLMFETPVSQVAGPPRTPFWEFAALLLAVGGVLVVAGDAEAEQLTADGTPLYGAGGAIAAGGARGWMRLPLLDVTDQAPPQLFASRSRATDRLEIRLRGRAVGAGRHYLRTARHAVILEAATTAGASDTLRMIREGGAEARVEFDTPADAKEVTVGVGTVLDPGRAVSVGAIARLRAARGAPAYAQPLRDGTGVMIRSAGGSQPVELEFERAADGKVQRVAMTIPPVSGEEVTMIRPADVVSPLGEMHVQRVAGDGAPIGPGPVRMEPRVIDAGRPALITIPR